MAAQPLVRAWVKPPLVQILVVVVNIHLATLRESQLLPPFTRAWLNFFTLTFRALGRNHIASAPFTSHRNALF